MLISIVIPCYQSSRTITEVVNGIVAEFEKQNQYAYEIILVNDGSSDDTYGVIMSLCQKNACITGIDLARNFGQGNAVMAGTKYVHGEYMVVMDDDGQHPAEGIFQLVEKVRQGYDLVYAYFPEKQHSLLKQAVSGLNNLSLTLLGNKSRQYHISSFAAYSSFSVKAIQNSKSPVNALGGYIRKISTRVADVPMRHQKRLEGRTTYTLGKMFRLWKNGITSFSTKALELAVYMGAVCAAAGFIYAMVIFIQRLLHPAFVAGYASSVIITLLLNGITMILIGILGEYIGRIFLILVRLPNYMVRNEMLNQYCGEDRKQMGEKQREE